MKNQLLSMIEEGRYFFYTLQRKLNADYDELQWALLALEHQGLIVSKRTISGTVYSINREQLASIGETCKTCRHKGWGWCFHPAINKPVYVNTKACEHYERSD